jgi:hypothetical protein
MAIKPTLFNTEMVRAILDGRKTCTRRIVKPQQFIGMLPDKCKNGAPEEFLKEKKPMFKPYCDMTDIELIKTAYKAPYQPGDILYVRETWCGLPVNEAGHFRGHPIYYYRADGDLRPEGWRGAWHPSIHMPKEAARIWLKVTDVRVERLQEMWASDASKEGLQFNKPTTADEMLQAFAELWNSTIKKSDLGSYGWDANPWVWVIEFERFEKPEGV